MVALDELQRSTTQVEESGQGATTSVKKPNVTKSDGRSTNRLKSPRRLVALFKYGWLQVVTGSYTQAGRSQCSVGAQGSTA
ncbi:hypothetical protein ILYODFUR_003583 [Ilyodon furcidens]|uniref:Uncharacterized protein n=1 Tax=Ilyodon furcidens TaxID=33524 RepID=A0ABV0UQ90_9TELE